MRIALISPYDERCYGMRHVFAFLRQQGHEVWFIVLKQYLSKPATLEQLEAVRHPPPGMFSAVTETLEDASYICCYTEPITGTEYQLLLEKLGEIRPDLIGISMTTPTAAAGREIAEQIRREFPRVPIVAGGIHPTIAPEQCIEWADIVCVGEGEYTMAEIAADPERLDIAGVWRRKADGEVIRNPIRPLEQNLDLFPFPVWGENECRIDWNQILPLPAENRPYFRGIYFIMTQRGCPFSCSYCYNHVLKAQHRGENYMRRRSVENVLEEIEKSRRLFGLTHVMFQDDVFVKDPEWIEEFADKYPRRIGLPFGGYAHPLLSTEAMLEQLARAGLKVIQLGVESGSRYILEKVYNRRHGIEKLIQLAKAAEKHGIALNYEILSNCDYESEADCLETLKLLTRLPKTYLTRVLGLAVFPPLRIAKLELPKPCLSETTFEFWNLLYLLTHYPHMDSEPLLALSQDSYLKAHLEILRDIAVAFRQLEQQIRADRAEIERLKAEYEEVSLKGLWRRFRRCLAGRLPQSLRERVRGVFGWRGN